MEKWGLVASIILGLLGLGVMAGQGFEFNAWVFLFWGAAAVVAVIAWLQRAPPTQVPMDTLGDIEESGIVAEARRVLEESERESARPEHDELLRAADREWRRLTGRSDD